MVPDMFAYFSMKNKSIKADDVDKKHVMSDEQIRELLKKGFTFRHKTLEERAKEFGELIVDGEFDCGEPVGREVW